MSVKDKLKQKAAPKLATSKSSSHVTSDLIINESEIDKITRNIQSDLEELRDVYEWWKVKKERVNEIKQNVIKSLIYVRTEKKRLLGQRTFEEYLTDDIGISKGYFYEQLQAYNICLEYNQPDLFKEVDHKILVNIAREKNKEKQKNLINRATDLSRDDFLKPKRIESKPSISVFIDRENMVLTVSNKKALSSIEKLLKQNGYQIETVIK